MSVLARKKKTFIEQNKIAAVVINEVSVCQNISKTKISGNIKGLLITIRKVQAVSTHVFVNFYVYLLFYRLSHP